MLVLERDVGCIGSHSLVLGEGTDGLVGVGPHFVDDLERGFGGEHLVRLRLEFLDELFLALLGGLESELPDGLGDDFLLVLVEAVEGVVVVLVLLQKRLLLLLVLLVRRSHYPQHVHDVEVAIGFRLKLLGFESIDDRLVFGLLPLLGLLRELLQKRVHLGGVQLQLLLQLRQRTHHAEALVLHWDIRGLEVDRRVVAQLLVSVVVRLQVQLRRHLLLLQVLRVES